MKNELRFNKNATVQGFSLLELLIAMAVGTVVLAAATQLFKTAMDATLAVTQRDETEQNVRSALNLVARDASMAGSGLPSGGLTLPYGGASNGVSLIGIDQTGKTWMNADLYANGNIGTPPVAYSNYMFGIIPRPGNGMEKGGPASVPAMAASGVAPDSATFTYVDYSFPLNQFIVTFPDSTGTSINVAPPAVPPPNFPAILSPNGIIVGDLILLTNSKGSVIGEVTGINPGGTTISFVNLDPLNINQSGATSGNIAYVDVCNTATNPTQGCTNSPAPNGPNTSTIAYRVYAISYFLEVPAAAGSTPRLMRQVNSQVATPVADNIIALGITYDLCTATPVVGCAGQENPILAGYSPNQIEKANITITGQSMTNYGNKSKSTAISTSVSTRNLTYVNRYK